MSEQITFLIFGAVLGITHWVAYHRGVKSQRVIAVRHELAEWIVDDKCRTYFVWKNGLPGELRGLKYTEDYIANLLKETTKERDLLRDVIRDLKKGKGK